MTLEPSVILRLQFLVRVVRKECKLLAATDERLFAKRLPSEIVARLDDDPDLAERVEAFASRFSRLQDTLGDKLLLVLLAALGEKPAAVIDNLDKAERLGLIASTDDWMTMRSLRNQMVHEYGEDPVILGSALQAGHLFVPELVASAEHMIAEIEHRGWLTPIIL